MVGAGGGERCKPSEKPRTSRKKTLIMPALGPSNSIQAIAVMKLGMTKATRTAMRKNFRPAIFVRDTAQAIGIATTRAKKVVATLMMSEFTKASNTPGSEKTRP